MSWLDEGPPNEGGRASGWGLVFHVLVTWGPLSTLWRVLLAGEEGEVRGPPRGTGAPPTTRGAPTEAPLLVLPAPSAVINPFNCFDASLRGALGAPPPCRGSEESGGGRGPLLWGAPLPPAASPNSEGLIREEGPHTNPGKGTLVYLLPRCWNRSSSSNSSISSSSNSSNSSDSSSSSNSSDSSTSSSSNSSISSSNSSISSSSNSSDSSSISSSNSSISSISSISSSTSKSI
ncbi:hypothetical protein ACSSS7_000186 [Eimeria intestinalis]